MSGFGSDQATVQKSSIVDPTTTGALLNTEGEEDFQFAADSLENFDGEGGVREGVMEGRGATSMEDENELKNCVDSYLLHHDGLEVLARSPKSSNVQEWLNSSRCREHK